MKKTGKSILLAAALAALAGGAAVYFFLLSPAEDLEGLALVNGRIEGERITLASKDKGRAAAVLVRLGDTVDKGQPLVRLESERIKARTEQAREQLNSLEAKEKSLQLKLKNFREETRLRIEKQRSALEQATAGLKQARAREEQKGKDARRFKELASQGTVAEKRKEDAVLAWEVSRRKLQESQAELEKARKAQDQALLGRDRIKAREDELRSLKAETARAAQQLKELQAVLEDMTIRAPAQGTVTELPVEPGESVAAGGTVLELFDLNSLYLEAYVPETQVGRLAPGQPARVYVDAWPEEYFPATVRYIADKAEFTPREVQTREERTKLVYQVRLYLDQNPDHRLTPGLPADAVIKWQEQAGWRKPSW